MCTTVLVQYRFHVDIQVLLNKYMLPLSYILLFLQSIKSHCFSPPLLDAFVITICCYFSRTIIPFYIYISFPSDLITLNSVTARKEEVPPNNMQCFMISGKINPYLGILIDLMAE